MDQELTKYRLNCTLTFGDIYGQIIVWLIVILISLATTIAFWSSSRQTYAFLSLAIIVVLSLPFLLFAFVTTLLNHIEFIPVTEAEKTQKLSLNAPRPAQKPAPSAG
ncbi:hypothetical protein [Spirulina subsalsa]|uniref:hypothetical protein n=1 Tax=Spirulina subsalsa TaxID=54311 RepID=UPI0002E33EDE|nr:hypothetical protein [Spirulina subsalsa]